jgi:PII-like signaling protein
MSHVEEAALLRVYMGESDREDGHPLHEAVVLAARGAGLAGATVLRGALGFGRSSRLHSAKILRLSDDLPLVVEIVDRPDRIEGFLDRLTALVGERGLITLETVRVVKAGLV